MSESTVLRVTVLMSALTGRIMGWSVNVPCLLAWLRLRLGLVRVAQAYVPPPMVLDVWQPTLCCGVVSTADVVVPEPLPLVAAEPVVVVECVPAPVLLPIGPPAAEGPEVAWGRMTVKQLRAEVAAWRGAVKGVARMRRADLLALLVGEPRAAAAGC